MMKRMAVWTALVFGLVWGSIPTLALADTWADVKREGVVVTVNLFSMVSAGRGGT